MRFDGVLSPRLAVHPPRTDSLCLVAGRTIRASGMIAACDHAPWHRTVFHAFRHRRGARAGVLRCVLARLMIWVAVYRHSWVQVVCPADVPATRGFVSKGLHEEGQTPLNVTPAATLSRAIVQSYRASVTHRESSFASLRSLLDQWHLCCSHRSTRMKER